MNSALTVVTKFLVFIPIAIVVYYLDIPGVFQLLGSPQVMSVVAASLLVFAFGVALKRKILTASLDLSQPSFVWGTLLLSAFAFLYLLGSYSAYTAILRFESFCFLLLAYVAYRIGTRIIKALLPLLPVVLLGFPSASSSNPAAVLAFGAEGLLLFWAYVGLRPGLVVFPAAFFGLGVATWFFPIVNLAGLQIGTWIFDFLPLVSLASPGARQLALLPPPILPPSCQVHNTIPNGFCLVCGRRTMPSSLPYKFAPWGLVTVLGLVAVLVLASVPVLVLSGNVPYDSTYTPSGFSGTITPNTPPGWQVNSTKPYDFGPSQPYTVERVYVPLLHPEVKNYTMYYEIASTTPSSPGPDGGELPGWSRVSNNFTVLGPLRGYLTTYQRAETTLLVYQGKVPMTFLNNGTFGVYYVGLGLARQFKDVNIGADSAQFLKDVNSLWVPQITTDVYYSGWTEFLWSLSDGVNAVTTLALVVSTSLLIAWGAYRARLSDQKLDDFIRKASRLSRDQWEKLSTLLGKPMRSASGFELSNGEVSFTFGPDSLFSGLRDARLIEPRVVERGDDLVLTWSAVF